MVHLGMLPSFSHTVHWAASPSERVTTLGPALSDSAQRVSRGLLRLARCVKHVAVLTLPDYSSPSLVSVLIQSSFYCCCVEQCFQYFDSTVMQVGGRGTGDLHNLEN